MRLYVAALVAVATILASATAEVDSKTALAAEVPAAIRSLESDTPASRLLRTGTVTSADNEDRGFTESATLLVYPSSQTKLKQLLETATNADDAFSSLKLNLIRRNLLKKSNFKVWVNYVNNREMNPQAVVLGKLKSHFKSEANLAVMLQKATQVESTQTMANELQMAQFAQWAKERLFATDIIKNVFKLGDAKWSALPITDARRQVRKAYSAYLVETMPPFYKLRGE
ncbi:hypothetical protein PHYSODRAFT_354447 [Phytophthora sojae]|uniref:RxLR effector protein n=2 Tax=Phytophthora sojae TaxID=67593 RepID=G4Z2U4_PHYSP|nr:hypothetical protein PHYSODRAFT_354447 [Phytophthora sojae]AEK80823.1 Avh172 [Phytophthora sojae]EGZ22218.1 hypothetical protein PHYSODRAFT_354447 [Phytophthora sojae]|eukprot:XP_009524935.1 hypothetical protein PHYSODRAFT_354447 [Phytophthora sojae]